VLHRPGHPPASLRCASPSLCEGGSGGVCVPWFPACAGITVGGGNGGRWGESDFRYGYLSGSVESVAGVGGDKTGDRGAVLTLGQETRETEQGSDVAVSVRGVYKVFGGDVDAGIEMAKGGASKDEIQEATGSVLALSDVSFDAARGEIFVVMGLSGCGKSTLIRCINRLIEADRGEIWIGEDEVRSMSDEELLEMRRSKLAMVFQHFGLMPHRSVVDNVSWGLELGGVGRRRRRARAVEALEAVGLGGWERNMPDELSGGMKQRVGLARAFAMDAPVMLMDEPFSALDPVIRRDLQEELVQTQASMHKTIIFITHDLSEAANIGDRIAIMRDGAIIQSGTPTDVVLHPKNAFVRDFTKDVRQYSLMTAAAVMGEAVHVVSNDSSASDVLEKLIEEDLGYALVVDGEKRYVGTARLQRISSAVRSGVAQIGDVTLTVDEAVTSDTVLDELVPYGLRADHSVPVLDAKGVLIGEIELETLAEVMDPKTEFDGNGTQ